jgi:hypothetical protein
MAAVAEGLFDDPLPAETMEEGGFGKSQDEGVPGVGVAVAGGSNDQGHAAISSA